MRSVVRVVSWCALLILVAPILASTGCTMWNGPGNDWRSARRDSSGQAPNPSISREAVVQVYAARTVGWRGALAVHTWISLKPADAAEYTRYEVVGWGVTRGLPALRVTRGGPDNYWFGAVPEKLVDRRGPDADAMIKKIEEAARDYPFKLPGIGRIGLRQ